MPSNSLPDADFNLPEMKTKSPSCPSGRVHMYAGGENTLAGVGYLTPHPVLCLGDLKKSESGSKKRSNIYTPGKLCLWGGILFSCCPSIRPSFHPSVTFWFFFNILKRRWKFIKFCRHIDIDKMYIYNRKLRARGQFYWSYCPL